MSTRHSAKNSSSSNIRVSKILNQFWFPNGWTNRPQSHRLVLKDPFLKLASEAPYPLWACGMCIATLLFLNTLCRWLDTTAATATLEYDANGF